MILSKQRLLKHSTRHLKEIGSWYIAPTAQWAWENGFCCSLVIHVKMISNIAELRCKQEPSTYNAWWPDQSPSKGITYLTLLKLNYFWSQDPYKLKMGDFHYWPECKNLLYLLDMSSKVYKIIFEIELIKWNWWK